MEIRERRSPKDNQKMLSTVERDIKHQSLKEYDVDTEAESYNTAVPLRSSNKGSLDPNDHWPYPIRPAFPNDEFDEEDDDDDDDEDDDMAMMTTCCCCLSTKNGSIAVGVICLVVGFGISVASCFALINVDNFQTDLKGSYDNYKKAVAANITVNRFAIIEDMISVDTIIDNLRIAIIVCLVFYALYTFSSLFMTYGACSDLRSLLLPWIVMEFVPFGIQLAGIVVVFVYGKDDPTLSEGGIYIIAGLVQIVAFVIHVYWWMCPVAHYQNLKESTEIEPLVPPSHPLYPNIQKY